MNLFKKKVKEMKLINPFMTINEMVYKVLKEAIISNEFIPMQRLYENELSEMFGVSRTPIREAFKRLEDEGYVETRKRKGTYISPLKMNKLEEIFYARMGIEMIALQLAIKRMTPKQLEKLQISNKKIIEMRLVEGKKLIMKYDYNFHNIIFESCGNQYLKRMNEMLRRELLREEIFRTKMYNLNKSGLNSFKEVHNNLFQAIKKRDEEMICSYAYEHSKAVFNYYGLDCEI